MANVFAGMSAWPDSRKAWLLRGVVLAVSVAMFWWWSGNFHWSILWVYRGLLLDGLARSIFYAVASMALGIVIGTVFAALRLYGPVGIRHVAVACIETVRATPQLMVIFWVYFTIPGITGESVEGHTAALIAVTAIAAAYLAEDVRAGLRSVAGVQWESGYATGLKPHQIFFSIILPQALRNMLPAILVTFVTMIKVTSLIYVVGVIDIFRAAILINNKEFAPYTMYTSVAIVYFALCYGLRVLMRKIDPKYSLTS